MRTIGPGAKWPPSPQRDRGRPDVTVIKHVTLFDRVERRTIREKGVPAWLTEASERGAPPGIQGLRERESLGRGSRGEQETCAGFSCRFRPANVYWRVTEGNTCFKYTSNMITSPSFQPPFYPWNKSPYNCRFSQVWTYSCLHLMHCIPDVLITNRIISTNWQFDVFLRMNIKRWIFNRGSISSWVILLKTVSNFFMQILSQYLMATGSPISWRLFYALFRIFSTKITT